METKDNNAKRQAQAQFESVEQMIKRVNHCQECDSGEDCELTDEEILGGLLEWYSDGDKATEEQKEEYHDEDKAREMIDQDPLSARVVKTYEILLCTGGPACRITGCLDEHGEPETAELQYQDWFTPWEDYPCDEETLLDYARNFYFGE